MNFRRRFSSWGCLFLYRSNLSKRKRRKPEKARPGGCMNTVVSNVHVQLRKIQLKLDCAWLISCFDAVLGGPARTCFTVNPSSWGRGCRRGGGAAHSLVNLVITTKQIDDAVQPTSGQEPYWLTNATTISRGLGALLPGLSYLQSLRRRCPYQNHRPNIASKGVPKRKQNGQNQREKIWSCHGPALVDRLIFFSCRGLRPGPVHRFLSWLAAARPAHQFFREWAPARPGPSNVWTMGRGPARSIDFHMFPARPGPAHDILDFSIPARPPAGPFP